MILLFFILGAILGSFFLVIGTRLPLNENVLTGRSRCDNCKTVLKWYELIPIFSFLFQRGKCNYCHKKISKEHLIMEIVTGLLFGYGYIYYGINLSLFTFLVILSVTLIIFISDFKYMIIIDSHLIIGSIIIFIIRCFELGTTNALLSILYGIIIIWNTITVLIFPFFNEPFGYHGWFLTGWMIHFCLGYYVDRAVTSSNAKLFYVMGICGAFINVMGATFFADRFSNPNDLAPTFIITCVGVMAFLQRKLNVSDERLKRITRFMSGYYFYIYMVHFNILKYITPNITNAIPKGLRFIPDVMVTFCISFVCFIILKIVITPCSNLLKKIL